MDNARCIRREDLGASNVQLQVAKAKGETSTNTIERANEIKAEGSHKKYRDKKNKTRWNNPTGLSPFFVPLVCVYLRLGSQTDFRLVCLVVCVHAKPAKRTHLHNARARHNTHAVNRPLTTHRPTTQTDRPPTNKITCLVQPNQINSVGPIQSQITAAAAPRRCPARGPCPSRRS